MPRAPSKPNQNAQVIDVDALSSPPSPPPPRRPRPPSQPRKRAPQQSQLQPSRPSQQAHKRQSQQQQGRQYDPDDLSDPAPDIFTLFRHYNRKHFENNLKGVYVEFSKRMTLCAGTCTYRGRAAGCRIALSEPLLKLRPATDLRSTLLHEMIHAHLFARGVARDGPDGHGPQFMALAAAINARERRPVEVTPYHTFSDEVDHYRTHHWRCAKCGKLIKRAMNRAPAPRDPFWPAHLQRCGGAFEKVAEPPKKERKAAMSSSQPSGAPKARPVAGVAPGTPPSQRPAGVVHAMRIDHMLANRKGAKQATVECPVCMQPVLPARMNEHLDACISADFADVDDVQEVPPSQPTHRGQHAAPAPPPPAQKRGPPKPPKPPAAPAPRSPPKRRRVASPAARPKLDAPSRHTTPSRGVSRPAQNVPEIVDITTPPRPAEPPTRPAARLAPFADFALDPRDTALRSAFDAALAAPRAASQQGSRGGGVGDVLRGLLRGPSADERARAAGVLLGLGDASVVRGTQPDRGAGVTAPASGAAAAQPRPVKAEPPAPRMDGIEKRESVPERARAVTRPAVGAPAVELGNCPICNVEVARSELQAHVNRCLDADAELTRELTGGLDGGAATAAKKETAPQAMAECPVCNVSVGKSELEAHVSECLSRNEELMNAF